MDFNSAIDIIIKDLEEARSIIDDLKKIPGVPAFQVELAKSKCRSAAEIIELLRSIPTFTPEQEKPDNPEIKPESSKEPAAEPKKVPVKPAGRPANSATGVKHQEPEEMHGEETLADRFSIERELNFPAPAIHSRLSEAIGINDRFHFIREIFDDNPTLYSEVISKLEAISSIEEARSLIMSYTHDESSKEAGKELLDFFRRKIKSDG